MGKRVFLSVVAAVFLAGSASAHEAGVLGELKGDKLGLYYTDHAISGHVNGQLVYAVPAPGGLEVRHRAHGHDFVTRLGATGVLASVGEDGTASRTEVVLKVNAKEGTIYGKIGGKPVTVTIAADKIEEGHFVDPRYEATVGDKTYSFRLENGKACMGCSIKISAFVLGTLVSFGVL